MRQFGPPAYPPPSVPPPKPAISYLIDCVNNYTYIWPKYGMPFWFYPTRIEYGEVSGYIWNGRNWTFYGFDPALIEASACYPIPTLY
ncbi:MAG TPA: transporter [Pseudobacteroides sp.]|uniref:transporter n=1 Tax=Pseudobacteroides sp. TaxID=1968840 RepID=UPI002F95E3E5